MKSLTPIAQMLGKTAVFLLVFCALWMGGGSLRGFSTAYAACPCTACACCCGLRSQCGSDCACTDARQTEKTVEHITDEFIKHREWLVTVLWNNHVLPAMMLTAEQLTAVAMQQMLGVGMIFDAKHQLETQRLFQNLHAEAHKDYSVSEGMCEFGTSMKSLAASDRNAEFTQSVIASRGLQRMLLSGDAVGGKGTDLDLQARMEQFTKVYCNPQDNTDLSSICQGSAAYKERWGKDVDYMHTVESRETLQVDFTQDGDADHGSNGATPDEEDIFALSANLYGNKTPPLIPAVYLSDNAIYGTKYNSAGVPNFLELRALAAKRSVAQNSFAAIAAMKAQGPKQESGNKSEVQPYLEAILVNMGIPKDDAKKMLGDRPSYYAQMEVLTRKLYQDPVFYADLYDKPANVARKDVAMRAIGSIQQRDMYRSWLRAESVMSVWLETELLDHADAVTNEVNNLSQQSDWVDLGN